MIPVMQTDLTFKTGNCMNACIASILEIPLENLPNFHDERDVDHGEHFCRNMRKWARTRGLIIMDIALSEDHDPVDFLGGAYVIASGKSPRATEDHHRHAVVWKDGKMVHDPHPDGTGLDGEPEYYASFISCDPKRMITYHKLRKALADLVGASERTELESMEAYLRAMPGIGADKIKAVNAIHALLETGD